ncbi:hypothetical protein JCM6882_008768 [Rhodosporidiobolus microsporus]
MGQAAAAAPAGPLHFLFSRYCLFEFSHGTVSAGDTATVMKRLEGWGRDEMPSWEEREGRWAEREREKKESLGEGGLKMPDEREGDVDLDPDSPLLERGAVSITPTYLTEKFLKKNLMREWLHVVSTGKHTYSLTFDNLSFDQNEEAED